MERNTMINHFPTERRETKMKRTKSDTFMILLAYHDQTLKDQLAWHTANNPGGLSEDQIAAFHAGFEHGWRNCVNTIKLHKIVL
jgi:hypothetical protein